MSLMYFYYPYKKFQCCCYKFKARGFKLSEKKVHNQFKSSIPAYYFILFLGSL